MANLMYDLMKRIIERGGYEKESILNKLDVFFAADRLSEEEYKELSGMVQQ